LSTGTKSIVQKHTRCTTQVDKTDKTKLFTMALEPAESQGCKHFLDRTFSNGVGRRNTGLQTQHS